MDKLYAPRGPDERRGGPRYAVCLPVRFCGEMLDFDAEAELDFVNAEAADISDGGLFIRSDFLEPPGTAVRIIVSTEDHDSLALRGRVAWVAELPPKGPGMGVEITDGRLDVDHLLRH